MRLLVDLEADADVAYRTSYHHKLRGRLWRALDGTEYASEHDTAAPTGLCFSNIFPWGEITEGDERSLLLASPREGLLAAIATSLKANPEFNVGDMPFTVTDLTQVEPDVGEPGTRGVIETATGVVVRFYDERREAYGIDGEPGTPTYWQPEHGLEPVRDALDGSLARKHDRFAPAYVPSPTEVDERLFDRYELLKTYALPTTVTTGVEIELVVSKWRFGYRVRDDTHRRHLNLALDTGLGGRNGLGFGFVNVVERTRPGETELEGADAFA